MPKIVYGKLTNPKFKLNYFRKKINNHLLTSAPRKRILIVPLDWGLGHATRDIPIIQTLLDAGCEVLIAAEGKHAALLGQEFPQLPLLALSGYRITYTQKEQNFGWKIVQQIPKIWRAVRHEQYWLRRVVREHKIDAVISDNRFGLYHRKIPTVFISHQLRILTPFGGWIERWLHRINYYYIAKYSACWVPDFPGAEGLAGILSHPDPLPPNIHYLGCLSRFEKKEGIQKKYDLLVLLSGPEPQRTKLEQLILAQIPLLSFKTVIVSGLPGTPFDRQLSETVRQVNHLGAADLNQALQESELVISRSGYTTVMDLAKLNKKAILIPTPGQSEQEYLAQYLMQKGFFYAVPQGQFILLEALKAIQQFPFYNIGDQQKMDGYKEIIHKFVASLK